ncbi:unnamed protein product [Hymenolepis diminuta]|uniref:Uncharacterized protein n=1 Tax=Hymenolepis diminuta TaxID=6216 RepID=A0A0R3S8V0_HYMDI|nr:unnamed protein product [Hymenolepis diminuta]
MFLNRACTDSNAGNMGSDQSDGMGERKSGEFDVETQCCLSSLSSSYRRGKKLLDHPWCCLISEMEG